MTLGRFPAEFLPRVPTAQVVLMVSALALRYEREAAAHSQSGSPSPAHRHAAVAKEGLLQQYAAARARERRELTGAY